MSNFISSIANWPFLDEPAYRWALFFIGFTLFIGAWSGVIAYMK